MNINDILLMILELIVFVLICMLLIIYFTPEAYADYEPVITEHKSEEAADFLWEELSKYSPNDYVTAGAMGYFWRESYFRSDAIAGWPYFDLIQKSNSSLDFTLKIDEGLKDGSSYDYFYHHVRDIYGGYGLGQWVSPNYLKHFYEFIREKEGSIGDAKLQCEFIFESMQRNEKLWDKLLEAKTASECGLYIGTLYDGTSMAGVIASHADRFYKEYHK